MAWAAAQHDASPHLRALLDLLLSLRYFVLRLFIKEVPATTEESRKSYIALVKGAQGDLGEIQRRWERHVTRFGPDGFPSRPQIDLGI